MIELEKLGLKLRAATATKEEVRIEVRMKDTDAFVAWFQSATRTSNGETVTSTNTQFVHLSVLTTEQVRAVKTWLKDKVVATSF